MGEVVYLYAKRSISQRVVRVDEMEDWEREILISEIEKYLRDQEEHSQTLTITKP